MKRRTQAILLLAAAGVALLALAGCDIDWESIGSARVSSSIVQTASFTVAGAPDVVIRSSNGAIDVRGVEGQTAILVTATLTSRGETLDEAQDRVSRIALRMEQDGNQVSLQYLASEQETDVRRYSGVAFEVSVPIDSDIEMDTSNGGISVHRVSGTVSADTSNGSVDVEDFVGEIDVDTSNGNVTVDRAEGVLRLDTSNGSIRVSDVEAAIDAETSNGSVDFSGVLVGDSNRLRSSNGRIEVEIPLDTSVRIEARTSNAKISTSLPLVGDTSGDDWSATLNPPATSTLDLRTSNGSIRIDGLPGGLAAPGR